MKKTSILLITTLFVLIFNLQSQTVQSTDSNLNIENAKYLKEDLNKLLESNIKYPLDALRKSIEGDVILSLVIDKNGKLDSLTILSSPDIKLSTSSVVSFDHVEEEWSPCKMNEKPIDKKYLIVFRYRLYLNTQPPNYKESAHKFAEKQKYKKALKLYNKAIKENQYNYELFESRSKIKKILGDERGSKLDLHESNRLRNKIISLVDITAIGFMRVKKTRVIY